MDGKESLSQSEFWEKELAEWGSSGLSALEYCRLKGLGRHKFFYWKKKLSKAPESVEFIEIPRVKADHKTKENKRPDLIVRKGQFAVEISPGFDPASLETVLKVIGGL